MKTSKKGSPRWILNSKAEEFFSKNHFYVFVRLNDVGSRPDFYIVPSTTVAEYCTKNHSQWLKGAKRDGSPRKDSSMRVFEDGEESFKESWKLLGLECTSDDVQVVSTLAGRMNDFQPEVVTPCATCLHRISGFTCTAFPNGIPQEILVGEHLHRAPYKGDRGIRWEERIGE